ncbi:MAG: type II secretion system protein [Lachnospiraceae bacterium]|nr:type II secretion system protein [Lachnospiraceae bacterium]
MKRREKKNNKGFSLVELIVVIAIMIVLVAVLAPVFTKYVEQSRRATDVQNANTIASAIVVGVTDGEKTITPNAWTEFTNTTTTGIKSVPKVKGGEVAGGKFFYFYDSTDNSVKVCIAAESAKASDTGKKSECSGDLTDDSKTEAYKNSALQ